MVEEGSCDVGVLNNLVSAVIDRVLDKVGDSVDLVKVVVNNVNDGLSDVIDGILDRLVRNYCVYLLRNQVDKALGLTQLAQSKPK